MKYFASDGQIKTYVLQLDQGDLLLESIETFIKAENIRTGAVIAAAGTFDRSTLHMIKTTGYPPDIHYEKREDEPIELVSVQGVIANGVPHLHATIANSQQAFGGHLEPGCRVLYLAEVVVVSLPGLNLTRVLNEKEIEKLVETDGVPSGMPQR
jgi:predicted DNA-binding protein with PD1-like motif